MDVTLTEVKLLVCGWIRWRRVRGVAKAHPEGGPGHQLEFPALLDATVVRHGMYQNPSWIQRRFVYFIHEGTMRRRLKANVVSMIFRQAMACFNPSDPAY